MKFKLGFAGLFFFLWKRISGVSCPEIKSAGLSESDRSRNGCPQSSSIIRRHPESSRSPSFISIYPVIPVIDMEEALSDPKKNPASFISSFKISQPSPSPAFQCIQSEIYPEFSQLRLNVRPYIRPECITPCAIPLCTSGLNQDPAERMPFPLQHTPALQAFSPIPFLRLREMGCINGGKHPMPIHRIIFQSKGSSVFISG